MTIPAWLTGNGRSGTTLHVVDPSRCGGSTTDVTDRNAPEKSRPPAMTMTEESWTSRAVPSRVHAGWAGVQGDRSGLGSQGLCLRDRQQREPTASV